MNNKSFIATEPSKELVRDLALALQIDSDYAYIILAEAMAGRTALLNLHGFIDIAEVEYKVGGISKKMNLDIKEATVGIVNLLIVESRMLRVVNFINNLLLRLFG